MCNKQMTYKQYDELLKTNMQLYVLTCSEILKHFATIAMMQGNSTSKVCEKYVNEMQNAVQFLFEATRGMLVNE